MQAVLAPAEAAENLAQRRLVKALSTKPDELPIAAAKTLPAPRRWARVGVHVRVVIIGGVFGLGAYAAIQGLIAATRHLGWLDWLHP